MTEIGHNSETPLGNILKGLALSDSGEAQAFEGYMQTAKGMAKMHEQAGGSSAKLKSMLELKLDQTGKSDKEFRTQYEKLVGKAGNPSVQKSASALRTAYVWMATQPKQLEWVRSNKPNAAQPTTMHKEWKTHQSSVISNGRKAGETASTIADRLDGVTVKEVQKKMNDAAKREANAKAKEQEQAAPEPAAEEQFMSMLPTASVDTLIHLRDAINKLIADKQPKPKRKTPAKGKAVIHEKDPKTGRRRIDLPL